MSVRKRAAINSSLLMTERVLGMGLGLGVNILLARTLGADEFGGLNYVLAFVALLTPFFTLGLNALVTRELINRPEDDGLILGSSCLARFGGGLVALAILGALQLAGAGPTMLAGWVFLVAAGRVAMSFSVVEFWFHAKEEFRILVYFKVGTLLLLSAAKVYAVLAGYGLEGVLWVAASEWAIRSGLLGLGYLRLPARARSWRFDLAHSRFLLRKSSWLFFSGFASMIYLKIDQVMLGSFLNSTSVGEYAVASRLSEAWYFLPTTIVTALFPALLKLRQKGSDLYSTRLQDILDLLFWVAFAVAGVVSLIAEPVVVLLYGDEYRAAGGILEIHVWAGLFIFMRALASKWLIAEDLLSFSLVTHGVGAAANVLANLYLIPRYGGEGAAWATLISYASSSYLAFFVARRTRPMAAMMSRAPLAPLRRLLQRGQARDGSAKTESTKDTSTGEDKN